MNYKSYLHKLKIFVALAFVSGTLYAQNDSISYGEEAKESSDYNYRKSYQYLDIKFKNEKWLLKVSPFYNVRNSMEEISLELAFERKLMNAFSIQLYTKTWMGNNFVREGLYGNLSLELRYYPGMIKRVANGLSGNNFSGIYLGLGISDLIKYSDAKRTINTVYFYNWAYPDFNIGYQSRLCNWAYLDVFAVFSYKSHNPDFYYTPWSDDFYSTIGFRLGFAWGK